MVWPIAFGCFLLLVVALRYLVPRRERCPQCQAVRDPEYPLCRECGWIYESPFDDGDYGDVDDDDDDDDCKQSL